MQTNGNPTLQKAARVHGKTLIFRNAAVADAQFILDLRTDPQKGEFLSQTSGQLSVQEDWLRGYESSEGQAYFIIEDMHANRLGTVRLYGAKGDSFCWGSWILANGAPKTAAVESALMVYDYAIYHLGFSGAYFDVRRGNERVWSFHERFGALRVGETPDDYFYEISRASLAQTRQRLLKFLPERTRCEKI